MKKLLIPVAIVLGLYAVSKLYSRGVIITAPKNSDEYFTTKHSLKKQLSNNDFVAKILRDEPKIKDAFITDVKVLYISVIDDGTKRNGLASYFCDQVKEYGVNVVRVKIVKAGSTDDANRSNSYGVLLGECWCK